MKHFYFKVLFRYLAIALFYLSHYFLKRFLTSLLAICYLFTGSGILLHQHYCMGEFVEGRLAISPAADTHVCSKCGMEQNRRHGCCETKTKLLKKVQDEQVQQMQDWLSFIAAPALLPAAHFIVRQTPLAVAALVPLAALQKPPPDPLPLFLEFRNLRI